MKSLAGKTIDAMIEALKRPFRASGVNHAGGMVPDPEATAGTTRFLREDATWAAPPGGGGGSGTVTSLAEGTGIDLTPNTITTTGTIALANTAVTPGAYTNLDATIDAQGRITAAANGSGGSTPTGTGFTHITAGVQDAAAKLVDTADINADQVTYAKMQNVSAQSKLLGRGQGAGAGDVEEIALAATLEMSGTFMQVKSGSITLGAGSQLSDMAQGTVIGRAIGAGTGPPTSLTQGTGGGIDSDKLDGRNGIEHAILAGQAGGQNLRGGTASGDDLTLESTSDATKGDVLIQPNGGKVGVGTSGPNYLVDIVQSSTGQVVANVVNANAGTSAYASVQSQNAAADDTAAFRLLTMGTAWSNTGGYLTDSAVLDAGSSLAGGCSIMARHPTTGDIRFYTGGYTGLRMTITNAGDVNLPGLTASKLVATDGSKNLTSTYATATAGGTANTVPVSNGSGLLPASFGGAASTLATLNASSLVVENPANATATPTASKIPIADASGLLDGWVTNVPSSTYYRGGNMTMNWPVITGQASLPEWWDDETHITTTVTTCTTETITRKIDERIFKHVGDGSGSGVAAYQRLTVADHQGYAISEPLSCSRWVYQSGSNTITLELKDSTGATLGSATTAASATWTLLKVENKTPTAGSTYVDQKVKVNANSATFYSTAPMLHTGTAAKPFEVNPLTWVRSVDDTLSTDPANTNFTTQSFATPAHPLACILLIHWNMTSSGGARNFRLEPAYGAGSTTAIYNLTGGNPGAGSGGAGVALIACSDTQVVQWRVSNADVTALALSLGGYLRWAY